MQGTIMGKRVLLPVLIGLAPFYPWIAPNDYYVQAREVVPPEMLLFAAALGATLEGKTAKQRNPHSRGSLAWLAWIVARLGGWSGYQRYGPPGPKTMAAGWERFIMMQQGWALRRDV
jgi:hypothetical protein